MLKFLAFLSILVAFSRVAAQTSEYFPLKPGTKKYFQATINQTTGVAGQTSMSFTIYSRNTEEVMGSSKVYDKPAILVRTTRRDSVAGRPIGDTQLSYQIENHYQARPQGVFLLANLHFPPDTLQKAESTRYEPPLQILKLPADSGVSWKVGTMKMQGVMVDLGAQVLGWEDVEVPAGSFKNCLKVKGSSASLSGTIQGASRLSMNVSGGEFSSISWYAPGTGLVKQEISTRFVMTSPNLPPGMTAEFTFQQTQLLTQVESSPPADKKEKKKN